MSYVLSLCSFVIKFGESSLIVGADSGEGPPVPLPNTVVKLINAESTWLETAWEDRKPLID